MPDQLSTLYSDLLEGSYDCVDRVVLNAYFGMGQTGGGLRIWWRALYGSDETLDDNHLMRMAGRFSRRLRAWAKEKNIPVVYSSPGERKHDMAAEHLATHEVKPGLFMVLVSKAPGVSVGSANDGRPQARSTRAEKAMAVRESLFLSYPRSGLGPSDHQDERSSAVWSSGDAERSRIRSMRGTKGRHRIHQTGQLLYCNRQCRRVGADRRYLVSERDCRAAAPTLRALDLYGLSLLCAGSGRAKAERLFL